MQQSNTSWQVLHEKIFSSKESHIDLRPRITFSFSFSSYGKNCIFFFPQSLRKQLISVSATPKWTKDPLLGSK